jgi:hypothetical protein
MKDKYVNKYIQNLLNKYGIQCATQSIKNTNYYMCYQLSENKIYFNLENIKKLTIIVSPVFRKNDVLKIILAHEIGHYKDFKNNGLHQLLRPYYNNDGTLKYSKNTEIEISKLDYLEFKYEKEYMAWYYGKNYINRNLLHYYNLINNSELKILKAKIHQLKK